MYKKIMLASAMLVTSATVAYAQPVAYVGAGLGMNLNTANNANTANYRGMPMNVFAGIGGIVAENVYLAGEVGATPTTADIGNENGMLKTTYSYGASVLPGVMLSDHTMAFARVGAVETHFSNAGTTKAGFIGGIGMQTSVMQNVDIRGEYDYTGYHTLSHDDFRAAPHMDAVNLGLVYKFD